jgi:lysophospholipase L1-like esterase
MSGLPGVQRRRGRSGRIAALAAAAFLAGCGVLLAAELMLQVAALVVPDRASAWRPEAEQRILAVGDSHTWGTGVTRDEAYPAQLQERLDVARPGDYSVMNLGLPGMSTTQLRHRLPLWLNRYRPDRVIVWCGANNRWNEAELETEPGGAWPLVDGALSRLRLYRLVRVWLHDRPLERYAALSPEERTWAIESVEGPLGATEKWTVHHDGVAERIAHSRGESEADAETLFARTAHDLEQIAATARAAGVSLAFVTYPVEQGFFAVVNRAVRQVAEQHDLAVVEGAAALERIPPEEQRWEWALHPDARLYGEVADDLARAVLAGG